MEITEQTAQRRAKLLRQCTGAGNPRCPERTVVLVTAVAANGDEVELPLCTSHGIQVTQRAARKGIELKTEQIGPVRGLRCNIYRPAHGDCSNGGLSGRVTSVTLVGPGIAAVFEPLEGAPAVELRELGGMVSAKPAGDNRWWMFGGCFIYSSDSRFPSNAPIALHDRTETSEESALLSR